MSMRLDKLDPEQLLKLYKDAQTSNVAARESGDATALKETASEIAKLERMLDKLGVPRDARVPQLIDGVTKGEVRRNLGAGGTSGIHHPSAIARLLDAHGVFEREEPTLKHEVPPPAWDPDFFGPPGGIHESTQDYSLMLSPKELGLKSRTVHIGGDFNNSYPSSTVHVGADYNNGYIGEDPSEGTKVFSGELKVGENLELYRSPASTKAPSDKADVRVEKGDEGLQVVVSRLDYDYDKPTFGYSVEVQGKLQLSKPSVFQGNIPYGPLEGDRYYAQHINTPVRAGEEVVIRNPDDEVVARFVVVNDKP